MVIRAGLKICRQDTNRGPLCSGCLVIVSRLETHRRGRQEFWRAFEGANENKLGTTKNYDERAASAFLPKASQSYQATRELLLRASYGNAHRFPGVTELFQRVTSPTGILINNPDLKPEQVDSYELSAEYNFGKHTAHLALFHEDWWDAITFQTDVTVMPNVSSAFCQAGLQNEAVELPPCYFQHRGGRVVDRRERRFLPAGSNLHETLRREPVWRENAFSVKSII